MNKYTDYFHEQNTYRPKSDMCKECGKWLGKGYICDDCEP